MILNPPTTISLYVHLPWCVRKCPYCDFNSHALRASLDEESYVNAVLNDLAFEAGRMESGAELKSVFFGGGTPSLFSPQSIDKLLQGISSYFNIEESTEITLEANPGAADQSRFSSYRRVGVNRLSIGIQSFNDRQLHELGRIHGGQEALDAVEMTLSAGFDNFNLDMMYGLPQQTIDQARQDIEQAIALSPTHISAYQLTIEPNTLFAVKPPVLPDEETGWQIQQLYWTALRQSAYQRYEVSAYGKPGRQCLHNLNYWQFGDYLGIGAGAHGKLSKSSGVFRTLKPRHPSQYIKSFCNQPGDSDAFIRAVNQSDLPLEYMMNRLRLTQGFALEDFEKTTGVDRKVIAKTLNIAVNKGLLTQTSCGYRVSETGQLFLDDLVQLFLTDQRQEVA